MPHYTNEHIITTVHDFKTHISKYMRMLDRGDYRAVLVKRYTKTIGVFQTLGSIKNFEARQKAREEAAARDDDMALVIEDAARPDLGAECADKA